MELRGRETSLSGRAELFLKVQLLIKKLSDLRSMWSDIPPDVVLLSKKKTSRPPEK